MFTKRQARVRSRSNKTSAQNGNEASVYLYGPIGGFLGVDPEDTVKSIHGIKSGTINLHIDSEGGDIFAARAIKTALMKSKAKVVAHIDGLAASAASFITMGADEIEMVEGGFFMIHNAVSLIDILGFFNIDDMDEIIVGLEKEKDLHAKINESIANDYMTKTGKSQAEISAWMDDEAWFNATEALENGFIDRIYDGEPVNSKYDLSGFVNIPEKMNERSNGKTERTLEKALRDAGLSQVEAMSILAVGLSGDRRDVESTDDTDGADDSEQREVEPDAQRDDENVKPKGDWVHDLLIRAEVTAPSCD